MSDETLIRHKNGAIRRANGTLAPGHSMGRKPKAVELEVLNAINRAAPPEKIEKLITDAFTWCEQYKSVKGTVSLLTLLFNYQLGAPIKRVVSAKMTVADILASVGDMDDDQLEDAIDALYESD